MSRVLITGATSGLGYQLMRDYAEQGWEVYACGRNAAKLESITQINNVHAVCFDVTDSEQVHQALENVPDCELIILNAGSCEYIEHGELDSALFRRVFETNFFGVVNCIEALQAKFRLRTHLVLIGSSADYVPLPRAEAYGASKAALRYLASTLSVDLASKGVDVSLVCPGFIETPLTDKNDFAMPCLISVEEASKSVREGVEKRQREVHFPKRFTLTLKCIALLPLRWQLKLVGKLIRSAT
ncbi:SDR family NAD(P)-dependent oxidoreductase [Thaumasiovibrio sp. DFM-14]|uniref:SDR family NAD(P)-dependent oxidoreductase n=1 Tax=Thaumasiovibrio sp. DFM-14 TaxID=3384792 RepID=UPI00399F63EB